MKVCPNKNTPEWKALELAVGQFEAMRDFMETDGDIRTPEVVQAKLDSRAAEAKMREDIAKESPQRNEPGIVALRETLDTLDAKSLSTESQGNVRALEIANKLSLQLNVDYEMITSDQAAAITAKSDNPWAGEAAFFVGGKVYFVGDKLDLNTVLHEFSHPLVRHMSLNNRELFEQLYQQIQDTEEGQKVIRQVMQAYPDLSLDYQMEEVIVRSLAEASRQELDGLKTPTGFAKVIKEIMYAIKQMLRGILGQNINISLLGPSTTINDMAEMLMKGGKFDITVEEISQEDVVAYMKDTKQAIEDLEKLGDNDVQALINKAYTIANQQLDTLLGRKDYKELANLLTNEYNQGELQMIRSNLSAYQTAIANLATQTKSDMEHTKNQMISLVNTIFRLESVMEKVLAHTKDLANDKDADNIGNLKKMYYYDSIVKYWSNFVNEAEESLIENGVPHNSDLSKTVTGIQQLVKSINAQRDKMYKVGARDALYAELEPMGKAIKGRYEDIIKRLKDKGAPQKTIDKWFNEYYGLPEEQYKELVEMRNQKRAGVLPSSLQQKYDRLSLLNSEGLELSPEKIEGLLEGKLGDANFFNSYLEGYLYNTDPVIGGLALYVKNNMNKVMVTAQAKFQDFKSDMAPLLADAGYNPHNIGKFGKEVGFKDVIGKRDDDGNVIEKEVWTLLNRFKGYRYALSIAKDRVDKAHQDYSETGSDEAKQRLITATNDRREMMRDYFHQQYTNEFYARDKILITGEDDVVGKEASFVRSNFTERMTLLTEPTETEEDVLGISDKVDALWSEYRQMHSLHYPDGTKKIDNPAKGIYDKSIAERLRAYRDASNDFYESKLREGAFETALAHYEQELNTKNITGKEFTDKRAYWIKKNTRVAIKSDYYDYRKSLIEQVKAIMKKMPDADQKALDMTKIWDDILDWTGPYKDTDRQTNGSEMSADSRELVRKAELELDERRKAYRTKSGLTPAESADFSKLWSIKKDRKLTPSENAEMSRLYQLKNDFGLDEEDSVVLDALYKELSNLSQRDATSYYVDQMNYWMGKLNTDEYAKKSGSNYITQDDANELLESEQINKLLGQNPEFDKWFKDNHIYKEYYDKSANNGAGAQVSKWNRIYVWSIVRPSDESYMESFSFINSEGQSEKVAGIPSMKYYAKVVKPEYRTERVVGETVDNQGQWLPKATEQGAKDGKFRNEEYYRLNREEPEKFKALMMLTKHHLANQEGLSYRSRLFMDFPRFKLSTLEALQMRKIGEKQRNAITYYAKRIKEFFKSDKDDSEKGFNYKEDWNLVRADMFDDEITSVPIAGLYDIDIEDTSTDITYSMMRYMLSAERQKQLIELSPVARAIQGVVNDPKNKVKDLSKQNRFNLIHRGITTYLNKDGAKVRAKAVDNFIEREFEGKVKTGAGSESRWLNNTSTMLFGRASFGFFALNIPSALKNSFGAKFQGMIEAAAGKHMNARSFAAGDIMAGKAMMETSAQIYKRTPKSMLLQMIEVFDPSQGRFEEKFGEDLSRTLSKDTASFSWLYNFRKWVELQATYQIFFGMMKFQEIEMADGTKIKYDQAWETVDGKIQLKAGVPAEWGITYNEEGEIQIGAEFNRFKNKMQQVMNNLQGAYSSFDQPEAQRYIAFRFLSYLRRYFTTMAVNRWGFSGRFFNNRPRLNPGLGDTHRGFYVTFLNSLKDTVTQLGRNVPYMVKEEKQAFFKVMAEIGGLLLITMALPLLFGWDPDDDDKYKKLREKSGALPFPFVSDEPGREFDGWGYLENHMTFLLMNIRAENEQFLPLPGAGLDDYSAMLDLKSIAFGPTVQTYKQIIEDMVDIVQGDESAYYRRRVGAYSWQDKGEPKIWAHLGRTIGVTGSSMDPAVAIKNFQSIQARAR